MRSLLTFIKYIQPEISQNSLKLILADDKAFKILKGLFWSLRADFKALYIQCKY